MSHSPEGFPPGYVFLDLHGAAERKIDGEANKTGECLF